jgi:sodium-dependent dicarboxylate transporter 2/3/5
MPRKSAQRPQQPAPPSPPGPAPTPKPASKPPKFDPKILVILALAVTAGFLPIEGLTPASRICLSIFVGAAGLWVTEAIPPFATAIAVIVSCVYALGRPGGPLDLKASGADSYQIFLNPLANPVLVLFFGGFILERAAVKHGFDIRLARMFLKPFGKRPSMILLGVILATATFSMFMSNTATTAMMIGALAPLLMTSEAQGREGLRKALALAVPFAANIGGMGTIIGTPPNAVAVSLLAQQGVTISFFEWMRMGVPLVAVLLVVLWLILLKLFGPRPEPFEAPFPEPIGATWALWAVVATFFVTVGGWMTEPLHGVPAPVVAMLPILVFPMLGIIDGEDLKRLEWGVLFLIAGGMTLGVAMERTGLANLLAAKLGALGASPGWLLTALVLATIAISNFMSNTSAANIMMPVAVSASAIEPKIGAMAVAFAASLAMSLPVSTPPNAIAYATKAISTRDMARYGTMVSAIGAALLLGAALLFPSIFS